jgi:single-stranded-DNA-specific exonuclease
MRRGVNSVDDASAFLNPDQYHPIPSCELPDLDKAVDRIQHAISRREGIIIWGDFDVDGQTSTALLFTCLKRLGANLTYHIPIRGRESHGISLAVLAEILSAEIRLLITCDTGICAKDAVEFGKEKGVDSIITDHHALPNVLPQAVAVVSSQRLAPGHPLNALCGVGVVYKLVEELYRQNGIISELKSEMDLVALGTIADIAFLSNENRYLVQRGLEQIHTCPRPALQAMLKVSKINHEHFTEEHISYFIAPRLNALGRFDDANAIIEFFLSKDPAQAEVLARKLEILNARRKRESDLIFSSAQDQIEHDRTLLDSPLLVLGHPEWPAPVIGVVASRLSEIYSLPVILFSTPSGIPARGSARSVEGINIIEMISSQKEKLISFGGHPMAAGLSIESDRIDDFRRGIGREISNSTH